MYDRLRVPRESGNPYNLIRIIPAEEKNMSNLEIKGLHALTDRRRAELRSLIEVIKMVIEGGAAAIQLRDKDVQ